MVPPTTKVLAISRQEAQLEKRMGIIKEDGWQYIGVPERGARKMVGPVGLEPTTKGL